MEIASDIAQRSHGRTIGPEVAVIGDPTLAKAIVAMAERETLTANRKVSDVLSALAPIQWLTQRAQGRRLNRDQEIELDRLIRRFHGDGEPLDFLMSTAVTLLESTNPAVAAFLRDWRVIDQECLRQPSASREPYADAGLLMTLAA